MSISFSLHRNTLNPEVTPFRAVVQSAGTMDYEQIVERVVKQNSTVTRTDVLASLNDFFAAIEDALLLGYNVNTPLANFSASIRGGFEAATDGFTPGRNSVEAVIKPGPRLRRTMKEAQAQKQESNLNQPRPLHYLDMNSGEINTILTPGGLGQLNGYRLKFDPDDPNQGIFFINGSTSRAGVIGHNGPTKLMFIVPAGLAPGDYRLEVRSTMGNGALHSGALLELLSVA